MVDNSTLLKNLEQFQRDTQVAGAILKKSVDFYKDTRFKGIDHMLESGSMNGNAAKIMNGSVDVLRKKLITFAEIYHIAESQFSFPRADIVLEGMGNLRKFEQHLDSLHPDISQFLVERAAIEAYGLSYPLRFLPQEFFEQLKHSIAKVDVTETFKEKYIEAAHLVKNHTQSAAIGNTIPLNLSVGDPVFAYALIDASSKAAILREYPLFHFFTGYVGAYYPSSELNLDALEKILDSEAYIDNDTYGRRETIVKLKSGSDQSRIRARISTDGKSITAKYLAIGVYGEKIDVVLKWVDGHLNPQIGLQHLDVSLPKNRIADAGIEIKTYGDGSKKMFLGGKEADKKTTDDSIRWLTDGSGHFVNQFMITENGTSRLNTAGIGGEALLHLSNFISRNYSRILEAAYKK
jgi:hypothetical protein